MQVAHGAATGAAVADARIFISARSSGGGSYGRPLPHQCPGGFAGDQHVRRKAGTLQVSAMSSGTVKFFNTEKGFGFITPDEGGKDVFVHKTGTRQPIYEGDKVTFEVEQSPKGPNAVNVTKA